MSSPPATRESLPRRDALWEDCRNNLGIARLLCREGRPEPLVATACRMAVETACRAALEQVGEPFDGDVPGVLRRLGVDRVEAVEAAGPGGARLAAAERAVAQVAAYLRRVAPEHPWGF